MILYPLRLSNVLKSPIWGGVRLLREWNKNTDAETVGESWELTVRRGEMSKVCNGVHTGRALRELIEEDVAALMGRSSYVGGEFPLLVKLIDAADRLSVQVHPDDAYAARTEGDRGKTEMWYIVEAEEGAEIVCGLTDGADSADFADAVARGACLEALKRQKVRAGETYFIPSGLPHAIGKGILIAEIQQNCDLTYRVYDYERRQKDGTLRELHVQKALDVIRPFSEGEIEEIRYARRDDAASEDTDLLADCAYFRVRRLCGKESSSLSIPTTGYLRHLLCIGGEGRLICKGEAYPIQKGDSYLLPAALDDVMLEGACVLLHSEAY